MDGGRGAWYPRGKLDNTWIYRMTLCVTYSPWASICPYTNGGFDSIVALRSFLVLRSYYFSKALSHFPSILNSLPSKTAPSHPLCLTQHLKLDMKLFIHVISFDPQNSHMKQILLSLPQLTWGLTADPCLLSKPSSLLHNPHPL